MTNKNTPHKRCSTCKELKFFKDFSKHKSMPDGHHPQCKQCRSVYRLPPASLAKARKRTREWNRFKSSGFTPKDFEQTLANQNGRCAICRTDDPGATNWHADHNHDTGQKRGILCHKCNTGLGLLKDDIDVLCAAIDYLKRYGQ